MVTRCKQLDSLLQERRETLFSLEANHDQVGSVVSSKLEGASAVDRYTRSLGGIETPEPLVVTRFPITTVVPVCVFTSVVKCVLQRAHSVGARVCVRAATCGKETPRVTETPCVKEIPCVSGVVASMPKCVLPSTPCVSETPCANGRPCVSGTTCAKERARVSEAPCVRGTACVKSLYVREMTVGMREHATACPRASVMVRCVSLVTRGSLSAWMEWRRRR